MNTKKVIAAIVLSLFTVPAFASAYTYSADDYPGTTETLVEGHTVFAVIQATLCIDNYGEMGTDPVTGEPYDNEEVVDCPDQSTTDFDVSWDIRANVTVQRLGTAVAVLVRDRVKPYVEPPAALNCENNRDVVATLLYENPGVLWFNDQFLVGDDLDIVETRVDANVDVCQKNTNVVFDPDELDWRYPCGGWVFATQQGNPDPRASLALFSYTESYQIIDPNDNTWIIDKYGVSPAGPIGADVPVTDTMQDLPESTDLGGGLPGTPGDEDQDTGADAPGTEYDNDDASDGDVRAVTGAVGGPTSTDTYGYYLGVFDLWSVPVMMLDVVDPGPTSGCSYTPYDEAAIPTSDGSTALYNAVMFFFFEDLLLTSNGGVADFNFGVGTGLNGLKVHGDGAPNAGDTNGCEADPANDGWESAPYDTCPANDDDAEGNSHAFNPNSPGDQGPIHIHPTAAVDLYFSNVQPPVPATRKYAVFDTVGSGAPYHAHPAGAVFDDRVLFEACGDADSHTYDQDYVYNGGGTYTGTYSETHTEDFRGGVNETNVSPGDSSTPAGVTEGEGEAAPGDGVNSDDCTGGYDGGTTGWDPSGRDDTDENDVPTYEYY